LLYIVATAFRRPNTFSTCSRFRFTLARRAQFCVHVYGINNPQKNPDCIFLWKVPPQSCHCSDHAGQVAKAIAQCQKAAPSEMSKEAVTHFNRIITLISDVPSSVKKALRNFIFLGDAGADGAVGNEYVDLVMNMANGLPIDKTLLESTRARDGNSRGGRGIGATKFNQFWEACKQVLLPSSSAEERRTTQTLYASAAHSIPNLVKQATDILQQQVNKGKLTSMPPIPSMEWVRLQFIPNNAFKSSSLKFVGSLDVVREIQTRTLRKVHEDQHWVYALTRYYLEWLVDIKHTNGYEHVAFVGQVSFTHEICSLLSLYNPVFLLLCTFV
jgi:hypothetical protein